MGMRQSNPNKWSSPPFRKLKPQSKLAYLYIVDQCDWAGFLEIDQESIGWHTKLNGSQVVEALGELEKEKFISTYCGWLFVFDFLEDQKNDKLNPNNNLHKNIIKRLKVGLEWFKDDPKTLDKLAPYKGLISS